MSAMIPSFDTFVVTPRIMDPRVYWNNIREISLWADEAGCTGVLLFTGNDTLLDPWIVADRVMAETSNLCPLVAVNPMYMHPFSAAKMVSSLVRLHRRRVHFNMVSGTARSHQTALEPPLSHDALYERLGEYIFILKALLSGRAAPLNFDGAHYQITNLQLIPRLPAELAPEFIIAGESPAAIRLRETTGAIGMRMLPATIGAAGDLTRGVHFGIVTRAAKADAWRAAEALFPEDPDGSAMLAHSMDNTEAVWKRRMWAAVQNSEDHKTGYWLRPFASFQADCPYVVADYHDATTLIVELFNKGVRTFILDIPAAREEFLHVGEVMRRCSDKIRK